MAAPAAGGQLKLLFLLCKARGAAARAAKIARRFILKGLTGMDLCGDEYDCMRR